MPQLFEIHPDNPQPRLLKQATALLDKGEVLAVPTDSSYALVCHLDDKAAADKLRRIRGVDDKHHLTLLCRDLSELANYARVDNRQFRRHQGGHTRPYTFILEASKEVPRRLSHPRARPSACECPTTRCCRPCWRCTPRPAAGHHADCRPARPSHSMTPTRSANATSDAG
jgi:tRNA threonylcarbamoyl adenosine modification protein (Sua5/YciO/YrdC/YwlC family)